jgi:hypothetical protein
VLPWLLLAAVALGILAIIGAAIAAHTALRPYTSTGAGHIPGDPIRRPRGLRERDS